MNILKKIIASIAGFFKSGKAEAALTAAANLVPKAIPIVQSIAALTPNKTDNEIANAFAKYGQEFSTSWLSGPPNQRGALLLHLASEVLAAELPSTATNVLNTAVQLAVTGIKA
jgi:hypothetical protein